MSDNPYRALILQHAKAPHGRGPLDPCDAESTHHNPLCGDRVTIRLRLSDAHIDEIRFEARGCAIAIASASILTERASGSRQAALALASQLIAAVNQGTPLAGAIEPLAHTDDDALQALAHIHSVRARRRCATLPWEALIEALQHNS